MSAYRWTIRRPMQSDRHGQSVEDLRGDPVVSNHRTMRTAMNALDRLRRAAAKQGGFCQDYVARSD